MTEPERIVTTQAEVDQAVADKVPRLIVRGGTLFRPLVLWGKARAVLRGNARAELWGNASAVLWDTARAELRENASAVLRGNARAELWDNARAELRGNARAVLWETARAELWDTARAELWDTARAELWGNARAVLRGNARAVLWDTARAELRENASAELWGNASAVLSRYAVAHRLPGHAGAVNGTGTVIVVSPIRTPQDWCDYYGVSVTDGVALVFKGVGPDYRSPRGTAYVPTTTVTALDWDGGAIECGAGLHFSPSPTYTHEFLPGEWITNRTMKYVACGVTLADMAIHPEGSYPHKCKASRCLVVYECDRFGEPVTA